MTFFALTFPTGTLPDSLLFSPPVNPIINKTVRSVVRTCAFCMVLALAWLSSTMPSGINFRRKFVSLQASLSFFVDAAVDHLLCLDEFDTDFVITFIPS